MNPVFGDKPDCSSTSVFWGIKYTYLFSTVHMKLQTGNKTLVLKTIHAVLHRTN